MLTFRRIIDCIEMIVMFEDYISVKTSFINNAFFKGISPNSITLRWHSQANCVFNNKVVEEFIELLNARAINSMVTKDGARAILGIDVWFERGFEGHAEDLIRHWFGTLRSLRLRAGAYECAPEVGAVRPRTSP
jgi:hypothetical protein